MKNSILIICLILLPVLATAQSRYLENGENGGTASFGLQFLEKNPDALKIFGAAIGIKGKFDIGIQYGKEGRYKILGFNTNYYVIKQKSRSSISLGLTGQVEWSKSSSYWSSNWSTPTKAFGALLESNLNYGQSFGVTPYLQLLYVDGKYDGYEAIGLGMSVKLSDTPGIILDGSHVLNEYRDFSIVTLSVLFK